MLTLKPRHQAIIAAAADRLPAEKRVTFLDRIKGQLQLRGFRSTDADLDDAMRRALVGLIQNSAA